MEARDILTGACDVLVCDGFAGNILLKSLEGTAGTLFSILKREFTKSWKNKLAAAVLMPSLRGLKQTLDYKEHGGAPLLGLGRTCRQRAWLFGRRSDQKRRAPGAISAAKQTDGEHSTGNQREVSD
ncbi:hypothetical protein HMSSN036_71480 [Paenibacillus macerans]|nr:hypothetical protein HMSSN036_71480 [Paenibacillus macerans]